MNCIIIWLYLWSALRWHLLSFWRYINKAERNWIIADFNTLDVFSFSLRETEWYDPPTVGTFSDSLFIKKWNLGFRRKSVVFAQVEHLTRSSPSWSICGGHGSLTNNTNPRGVGHISCMTKPWSVSTFLSTWRNALYCLLLTVVLISTFWNNQACLLLIIPRWRQCLWPAVCRCQHYVCLYC